MAFFASEQGHGEDLSAWIATLEELADEAELEDIRMEDILVFRILTGTTNMKFRNELTKLSEPTLRDYKRKVVDLEIAKRMEVSIDKNRSKAVAGQVKSHGQGQKQGQGKRMSRQEALNFLKGKCKKCLASDHKSDNCKLPASVSCHHCGKNGHLAKACMNRLQGFHKGSADSTNSKSKSAKVGKKDGQSKNKSRVVKSKSQQASPATSAGESDSEEEEVGAASVIRHKIMAVTHRARTVSNPTPRLPVEIRPRGKGTPFSFDALPDTGCTVTVLSEDVQRAYGLTLHRAKDKLVAADNSDLSCIGAVFINIQGKQIRALVSRALKDEVIIGWDDLIG